MTDPGTDAPASPRAGAVRHFGRLQLLQLLGKSQRTMAWRVSDPLTGRDLMLVLPRVQPPEAAAGQRWQDTMRQAARLSHPQLAPVIEIGLQDGWPYAAYDLLDSATLAERVSANGLPGLEAAQLTAQVLSGLAYAHEGGLAHHDLQPFLLLVGENGALRVAGLCVASGMATPDVDSARQAPAEPA
ncbi:MAG: protein kinase, partial [Chitinophagaceae bacterium]|nr:protein kinase [Rubrivivax sp.]